MAAVSTKKLEKELTDARRGLAEAEQDVLHAEVAIGHEEPGAGARKDEARERAARLSHRVRTLRAELEERQQKERQKEAEARQAARDEAERCSAEIRKRQLDAYLIASAVRKAEEAMKQAQALRDHALGMVRGLEPKARRAYMSRLEAL
jgi:protein subunit release factor B